MGRIKLWSMVILMFSGSLLYAQIPSVSSGTIERYEAFSSSYIDARNVDVWLPPGYTSDKQYAVVYMHDGKALFDSTIMWNNQEWGVDEKLTPLLEKGKIEDCIVVGIWNNGEKRSNEYFPQKAFEILSDREQAEYEAAERYNTGVKLLNGPIISDNYLQFMVKELKPFIDAQYPVKSDRENTFVMGSSYGGLISLYAICEYPEVFGGAACLSTHWIGMMEDNDFIPRAIFKYLEKSLPDPDSHKIYFDFGTKGLDAKYRKHQKKVDQLMKKKGFDKYHFQSYEILGGDHNENSWRKRLHSPIEFLLSDWK